MLNLEEFAPGACIWPGTPWPCGWTYPLALLPLAADPCVCCFFDGLLIIFEPLVSCISLWNFYLDALASMPPAF